MNPALTADEAGYQQSDSGAAVVVVGDASAQVLAGSGARHLHVDDLAVMGEEPVALAALKEEHHRRAGVARLRQGAIGPLQASQGGPAHRALPRNAVGKVAKPELRERASSRRGGADSSPPRSGKHGTGDRARRPGKAAGDQRIRFVDVDGIRIRAAVRGEGWPLLLIMGIGGNIEMWRPFEGALGGSGIQTITFDAPGVGASTNWRRPRRMDALARTVDRLIGALGYEAVDVLGVSFGGALAQQLVRQSPARVRRLVLAATAPGMPGIGGVPGRPSALLTLATPLRYYSPAYFRMVAPTLYGGRIRREPELLAEQARARIARPPSLRGYVAQLYAMAGWTNLPWLPFIQHPTLVMAGDDDPIIPLVNGRILARLMPLARLEVITGGGHLFLLEEAERSAALVREFLAQC